MTRLPPLAGVRVLDFSTLLPGPMCTLLLAEAGAEVLKIERPGRGDEMRTYAPNFGDDSLNFAMLNRGKRSLALDLKNADDVAQALDLARGVHVVVEQYRPGVMDRLGLGYDALSKLNPRLVYCSITGYGQTGPMAQIAAHDLNYQAEAGMLSLSAGADGAPIVPPALIADLAAGAYPAVMNILLALRTSEATGQGCKLDVSMADNLFPLMYWGLGQGFLSGRWPVPGEELVTGGSPRYRIYRTADDRFIAAAPLEQKFWETFLDAIEAPHLIDDATDPKATREAVARIIATRTAREWEQRFAGRDLCAVVVKSLEEAAANPHFVGRGLFEECLADGKGNRIPALPVPIDRQLRSGEHSRGYPALDESRTVGGRRS